MEFIRAIKSQTNYDANTRHCLHGLDADLILLGKPPPPTYLTIPLSCQHVSCVLGKVPMGRSAASTHAPAVLLTSSLGTRLGPSVLTRPCNR